MKSHICASSCDAATSWSSRRALLLNFSSASAASNASCALPQSFFSGFYSNTLLEILLNLCSSVLYEHLKKQWNFRNSALSKWRLPLTTQVNVFYSEGQITTMNPLNTHKAHIYQIQNALDQLSCSIKITFSRQQSRDNSMNLPRL